MNDQRFMRHAIRLAELSVDQGGGPFGAVVVLEDEVIGEGSNCVTLNNDPTAHAEVQAIRAACARLGRFDLKDCRIYTSCEPCPMCLGAIYWARLAHVFYGNGRNDAAQIGFDDSHIYDQVQKSLEEGAIPATRLLAEEARLAFERWLAKPDKTLY